MSDPTPQNTTWEEYKIMAQLTGAILSIIGGFAAVFIRARLDKRQEINYIKISINDELHDICDIIGRLNETYSKSQLVSNDYLNELSKSTDSYKFHKQRMFILNSESLRRDIYNFYKKLDVIINESRNRVGTLGEKPTDSNSSHDSIINKLTSISTEAYTLSQRLKKYKYRLFWYNK